MINNNYKIRFKSLKIFKTKNKNYLTKIKKDNFILLSNLKKNYVIIKVKYSNINYKDILMSRGHKGLIKKFPHTPGIDASGIIYSSNSKKFKLNDKVFVIAKPLGIGNEGGLSEYIMVPENWVEILPKYLNLKEIMLIGTAGYTAFKALSKTLKIILKNKNKPVLVTGACGSVGSFLISILSNLGVKVEALTSDLKNAKKLKKLGVSNTYQLKKFINTSDFDLLSERYSVVFDNLGGDVISGCLKYIVRGGIFISIGNVIGNISKINILPFILREVSILGLNTESLNNKERKLIINNPQFKVLIKKFSKLIKVVELKQVPAILKLKNYNKNNFRYVVKS